MTYGYASQNPELAAQQVAGLIFAGVNTRKITLGAGRSTPVPHVDQSRLGKVVGTIHTAELPYVFGTLPDSASAQDRYISELLMDAWVSFAKGDTPQDRHGVDWPKYTEANRDLVLIGQQGIDIGHDPDTRLLDHL